MAVIVKKGIKTSSAPTSKDFVLRLRMAPYQVEFITHEDDDGYMEGGVFRKFDESDPKEVDKHDAFVVYINECIADGDVFTIVDNHGMLLLKKVW